MKPFSSRKRILLSALLLFFTMLCAGTALAAFQNPKIRLLRAVKKTYTEEYLGFSPKEAFSLLQQDGFAAGLELTLNRLDWALPFPDVDPSLLEGLGVSGALLIDQRQEQLSAEAEITYLLAPYAHIEGYAGQGRLAVRIPELFDSYVQASPETLGRDYNASRLAKLTDFRLPENFSLRFFSDKSLEESGREDAWKALTESLDVKELPDEQDAFFAGGNTEAFRLTFSSGLLSRSLGILESEGAPRLFLPESCTVYLRDGYIYGVRFPFRIEDAAGSYTVQCRLLCGKAAGKLQYRLHAAVTPQSGNPAEALTLDALFFLNRDEAAPLTVTLENLDVTNTAGLSCSLYGSLALSPSKEPVLPPAEAECLPLFDMSAKECLRLIDEMWQNLSSSGLSFLKGLFQ